MGGKQEGGEGPACRQRNGHNGQTIDEGKGKGREAGRRGGVRDWVTLSLLVVLKHRSRKQVACLVAWRHGTDRVHVNPTLELRF